MSIRICAERVLRPSVAKGALWIGLPFFCTGRVTIRNVEIWKDVVGYEGFYQVSDQGRVRSVKIPGRKGSSSRVLKKKSLPDGRERVCLHKPGKNFFTFVSRLVAIAHIPNPENKVFVDHINHDLTNNTVANLRWATPAENLANRRPTRALPKGVRLLPISGKYNAYTNYKGKFRLLGNYDTADKAASVVLAFNRNVYGDFYCQGKSMR